MTAVTEESIRSVADSLGEGETGYVGEINGYVVSTQKLNGQSHVRVDQNKNDATTPVQPLHDEAKAAPSGCTTANIVAGGLFALGAAGIGIALAGTDGAIVPILGFAFSRAFLQQLAARLSAGAAFESIVAAVAPYVC